MIMSDIKSRFRLGQDFFFSSRRLHTSWNCDWSSDVCSSDLALLDDLTGVANRRHLTQRLAEECARSERSGEPFALLVIDLDGFKAINDTFGHAAGDACLQHFTLMAQTRLRPGDMLARTGGDEFCIVLPASSVLEGAMIARRVLDVCRQDAAACGSGDIPIGLSIGVAQWSQDIGLF